MKNPFDVVRDFEQGVAEYTGAPYVVAVNSCTAALMLAVAWHLRGRDRKMTAMLTLADSKDMEIEIPKRTYLSVPMAVIHAGGRPTFRDEEWLGAYQLKPLPVWDSARLFTTGMYNHGSIWPDDTAPAFHHGMVCTSHHWSKTLGIQQGGCILHDNPEADAWLRRARFDGRTEGVAPNHDRITMVGWHCYMSPEVAAEGLVRLHHLPKHNEPLPNSEYPDLSQMDIFK
ncbi:DegT/DnrJ/EryC1/StrS aminotransferase [uncultured Caudovirales phage]|uniref:DegT/DnrJ/EryC1/StrS aminotransferase n=1 Tax=uncultured Caudovirales phage TaxID=2100421 RepID=A0A6J5T7E1_9CAUD|nr:DegT/DnrJ/EryC1/StrS aminotransferase [uncultured Caudovirales phage]